MEVLLVPAGCNKLLVVKLPNPKNLNELDAYYYDEENIKLYENIKFHDKFRSWFLDNAFCKDGHFDMLTAIDNLFILMPHIKRYASEQFRSLNDICSTYSQNCPKESSKIDFALSPTNDYSLICDVKQLDDEMYIRFNEQKTLEWLVSKHSRCMKSLPKVLEGQPSKATLISYAFDLIDVYVPSDLSEKFKKLSRASNMLAGGHELEVKQNVDEQKVKSASMKRPIEQARPAQSKTCRVSQPNATKGGILKFFQKVPQ